MRNLSVQLSQHRHYIHGSNHKNAATTHYPLCADREKVLQRKKAWPRES